jgi:hypothetical protein
VLNIAPEIRKWLALGCVVVVLCLAFAVLTMCQGRDRAGDRTQAATGKALDKVATETPIIRQDQEEKQRAVDEIEGADTPLPDGFGADLQRLRDRRENPR